MGHHIAGAKETRECAPLHPEGGAYLKRGTGIVGENVAAEETQQMDDPHPNPARSHHAHD